MIINITTDEDDATDVNIWEDEEDTAENVVFSKRTVCDVIYLNI